MKNQLLTAFVLVAPALAVYLVPEYSPGGLANRDLYLDSDYDYSLLARSALYDDDGRVALYRRRGGGQSSRQNSGQLSPQNSKQLSPQNSLSTQSSYKTATSSPGDQSPRKNNEEVRVNIPKQPSTELQPAKNQPPKPSPFLNTAKQAVNFAKNNQNTLIGTGVTLGSTLGTIGAATGNKPVTLAGGAVGIATGAGIAAQGAVKDAQNKKNSKKSKRSLDTTLDVLFERRSLGIEYGDVDNFLMARALGIGMELEKRAIDAEEFDIEVY